MVRKKVAKKKVAKKKVATQDSRVGRSAKKANGAGARRKKTPNKAQRDRASDDREVTQDRVLSDENRLDTFRKSFFQSVLPDLPTIDGYHVCWLTTTNPRDSIQMRTRLGYEPVKQKDIPEWDFTSMKSADFPGCISINEMVAFKLPISLYEAYMYEAHHAQPLAEEEKLTSVIDVIREEAARAAKSGSKGIKFELEEGMAELGQDLDPGSFSENLGEI